MIAWGLEDGSREATDYDYPPYQPVNVEMPHNLPGTNGMEFPNRWQPLAFEYLVLQNGIVIGASIQEFIGPHWGGWRLRSDRSRPGSGHGTPP